MTVPTMPETMAIIRDPITDHQNPSMVTPTSNRLMASQDASSMNSQLMINAISPNERIENGNAMVCTIGLIDALINARNNANAPMPRMGGSPTACMPGSSVTMTPAAMVKTNQREMKCSMTASYYIALSYEKGMYLWNMPGRRPMRDGRGVFHMVWLP